MLLALALAGLTYALLNRDGGEPEAGNGGASSPATTGDKGAGGAAETEDAPSGSPRRRTARPRTRATTAGTRSSHPRSP
ncbi:hypothetical protein ACFQV4_17260 [Streptomyces thermocarboxydus]